MLCLASLCVRREYADATEHATMPHPIAPMGCSLLLTCLVVWQNGGGVYIWGGTVTLNSCDIYSNTAYVSACLHETTPSPDGVLAFTDVLCMAPLCARSG